MTLQVLLDRSGSGLISPHNLLAAAHTAVKMGVGVVPKTRVDINDILLQMVVQMKQEQQQHGAQQGFAVQVGIVGFCRISGNCRMSLLCFDPLSGVGKVSTWDLYTHCISLHQELP